MLGELFHIGVAILGTAVDATTNTILAQLGSIVEEYTFTDNAEWYQHVGFSSRPANPVKGTSAAEGCGIKNGHRDVIWASRDLRGQQIYGSLKAGETCLYASGADGTGQGRILIKGDGSVTVFTRKDANSQGMLITANPSTDTIAMMNSKGYGIVVDDTGIQITAGNSSLTLGADGNISLVGTKQTQVDGAGVVLGSVVAPVVNAAITGPTGMAGKASLKVLIE